MKLVALKDAYKTQALSSGLPNIKTFIFDNLSEINNLDKPYRVLLFKPPISVRLNETQRDEDRVNWSIEYFLLDLMNDDIGEKLAVLWESMEDEINEINKGITLDNTDIEEIISDISMDRGKDEHNQNLVGIRVTYTLRVFDCLNP